MISGDAQSVYFSRFDEEAEADLQEWDATWRGELTRSSKLGIQIRKVREAKTQP